METTSWQYERDIVVIANQTRNAGTQTPAQCPRQIIVAGHWSAAARKTAVKPRTNIPPADGQIGKNQCPKRNTKILKSSALKYWDSGPRGHPHHVAVKNIPLGNPRTADKAASRKSTRMSSHRRQESAAASANTQPTNAKPAQRAAPSKEFAPAPPFYFFNYFKFQKGNPR